MDEISDVASLLQVFLLILEQPTVGRLCAHRRSRSGPAGDARVHARDPFSIMCPELCLTHAKPTQYIPVQGLKQAAGFYSL